MTIFFPSIVTNGLVLCLDAGNQLSYPGTGTTWNDLSRNGNNGTLTNGPVFNSGGSMVFDGVNDYISLGTYIGFGSINRTIITWFRITTLTAGAQRIITFPADDTSTDTPAYTLNLNSLGLLQCGIGGSPYDGYNLNLAPYVLGTWANVSSSINGNIVTTY